MHLKTLLVIAFRQLKSFCSKSEFIFWILPKNPSKTFHSFKSTAVEIRISKIRYYLLSILVLISDPKTNQHWQWSAEIWSQECRTKMGSLYCPISSLSEAFSVTVSKVYQSLTDSFCSWGWYHQSSMVMLMLTMKSEERVS